MPLPWLVNQWACSQFGAEPERDAAVDAGLYGTPSPPSLAPWIPAPEPVKNPDDYTTADWKASLVADWPDVSSVIPSDKQVFKAHDSDVLQFLKDSYGTVKLPDQIQCFDRANYQLHLAEYRPSGPAALDDLTIMALHEYDDEATGTLRTEVQVLGTIKAVDYLKESLQAGIPMLVGLRLNFRGPLLSRWRPNERRSTPFVEPTNHFVVAVGMGRDAIGEYVAYFDYGHRHDDTDRLYLHDSLLIESADGKRTLTEVRISRPR